MDTRERCERLAELLGVPPGGRLEMLYDDRLKLVEVYVKPRFLRMRAHLLEQVRFDEAHERTPGG